MEDVRNIVLIIAGVVTTIKALLEIADRYREDED